MTVNVNDVRVPILRRSYRTFPIGSRSSNEYRHSSPLESFLPLTASVGQDNYVHPCGTVTCAVVLCCALRTTRTQVGYKCHYSHMIAKKLLLIGAG